MTATHAKAPVLAWILTALSCLLAGTAIFAVRPSPPVATGNAATSASRAAVQGFYKAVNSVIATGDAAPLAAVLTPGYAEADASGRLVPGRAALERSLRTLREIAPDLRLGTAELVGDGDRVVAVVAVHGAESVIALGLPLIAPLLWAPVDAFWVADGKIAAREGATAPGVLLERQVKATLDLPLTSARVVTIQRVRLTPAASLDAPAVDGLRVLIVEAGVLKVVSTGAAPDEGVRSLVAEDWLSLPMGATYDARNTGQSPAVFLEVLVTATSRLPGAPVNQAEGVTTQILAGRLLTPVPRGRAILTTGRLTLAPGARLAWDGPAGPTLLFVEDGMLGLATAGASAWVRSAVDGASESRESAMLAARDGARIGMGTGVEIRNAGDVPVELLVVTLLGEAGEPAVAD